MVSGTSVQNSVSQTHPLKKAHDKTKASKKTQAQKRVSGMGIMICKDSACTNDIIFIKKDHNSLLLYPLELFCMD